MAVSEPLSLYALLNKFNELSASYESLKASYESLLNDYDSLYEEVNSIYENGISGLGNITASAATLDPSSSATVGVTVSSENGQNTINFHFGVPKGETGADGATGEKGADAKFQILETAPSADDLAEGEVAFVLPEE